MKSNFLRISGSLILAFGWLFITPAYSDDPLSIAAQEIEELNASVDNLAYQDHFISLIDISEQKYDSAVSAKASRDSASTAYESAVQAEATALEEKNLAQSAVDGQTVTVATELENKNNKYNVYNSAQIALNAHIATYGNGGINGVYFRIYPLSRMGDYAYLAEGSGLMCHGSLPTFDAYAGWGAICGLSQNIIGIFEATVTVPEGINQVKFAGLTDDGFRLYVDGVLATEQWIEQGANWSPYTQWFDTSVDKTLNLQAWWYNGGGPGSIHVGVGTTQWWSGIPAEWITYGTPLTQQQITDRQELVTDRDTKYSQYQTALSTYNSANSTLTSYNQTLAIKNTSYSNAQSAKSNALSTKNSTQSAYDQSIIDLNLSIENAWSYYNKQLTDEIAAAIANAMANQPQPTPEPTPEITPEPTPEPSPEQTEPVDPTPEPTPETTDEPKPEPTDDPEPTPEPSPEPSPQPTDIDPEPTPEPEPTPAEPSPTPSRPNTITDEMASLIADLTSKDTLTKLSPEQKQAVAQGLGISVSEIALVAQIAQSNPVIASALEEFGDRIKENKDAPMPYTLADATTEIATEQFLADPIGALTNIDLEKVLSPSEWGKDMTDDQREKAQEVVIPVIIASNIVAAAMTRRLV